MAPNIIPSPTGVLFESDSLEPAQVELKDREKEEPAVHKRVIVWRNVILFAYLHVAAVYGFYLMITSAKVLTTLYGNKNFNIKYLTSI